MLGRPSRSLQFQLEKGFEGFRGQDRLVFEDQARDSPAPPGGGHRDPAKETRAQKQQKTSHWVFINHSGIGPPFSQTVALEAPDGNQGGKEA